LDLASFSSFSGLSGAFLGFMAGFFDLFFDGVLPCVEARRGGPSVPRVANAVVPGWSLSWLDRLVGPTCPHFSQLQIDHDARFKSNKSLGGDTLWSTLLRLKRPSFAFELRGSNVPAVDPMAGGVP